MSHFSAITCSLGSEVVSLDLTLADYCLFSRQLVNKILVIHKSLLGLLETFCLMFSDIHSQVQLGARPYCLFLFCCQSSHSLETVEYSSFALCNWAQPLLDSDYLLKMHHITWRGYHSGQNNSCKLSQFSRKIYIVCKIGPKMSLVRLQISLTPWLCGNQWKIKSYSTNLHTRNYHSGEKQFLSILPVFQENLHCVQNWSQNDFAGILKFSNLICGIGLKFPLVAT